MDYYYVFDKTSKRNLILADIFRAEGCFVGEKNNTDKKTAYIYTANKILDADEIDKLDKNAVVFGGNPTGCVKNIEFFRMMDDELYAYNISRITTEGALSIIISNTDFALYAANLLILGYGRMGREIARKIKPFVKNLSVCSFDKNEFHALANEYIPYFANQYQCNLGSFDIIINTVPARIITQKQAEKIKNNALFLDVASKPGALEEGLSVNFNYIHALQLPDKTAPLTAALELRDLIFRRLQ